MRAWRLPMVVLLAVASCASPATDAGESALAQKRSAIVGGEESDATDDSVVLLAFAPAGSREVSICTATLIAPRLVLTARHCVAETDLDVACGRDGQPTRGGDVLRNHPADTLYVFAGRDRPDLDPATWKPTAAAEAVIDDGATNLCNHDVALVLLKSPLAGVPSAAVRLEGDVHAGDRLRTAGWGVTTLTDQPARRQARSGVSVTRVGPDDGVPVLAPNEFLFGESICLGDSGGAVFAEDSHAVIGVVSRGGNGADPSGGPSATCTDANNLATRIAPLRDLLLRGYDQAGSQPVLEERPAEDEGCSTSSGRPGWPGLALVAVAIALCRRLQTGKADAARGSRDSQRAGRRLRDS